MTFNPGFVTQVPSVTEAQTGDVRAMSDAKRNALIVSAVEVDGIWVILSRYGDSKWKFAGGTTNGCASTKILNFNKIPRQFRPALKAVLFRYLRRGRKGQPRPRYPALRLLFNDLRPFFRHLLALKVQQFCAVNPMVCAAYVAQCRAHWQTRGNKKKPLSPRTLNNRFRAVEALHELSQYTDDPVLQHPWPNTSAMALAGMTGQDARDMESGARTPLIPDDVFTTLFQRAYSLVERGRELLELRDALNVIAAERKDQCRSTIAIHQNRHLAARGRRGGLTAFRKSLVDLRTACYVVLASVSGCRNHELAFLQTRACHRTEDDDGTIYHWMRSRSTKTDAGIVDWMVPEAAVRALRVMDLWAEPYQAMIAAEIAERRAADPLDPEIAEAQRHLGAVFLGLDTRKSNRVRTLSDVRWCHALKEFARACGLNWSLATHQFRRKFANYAARSQFGDLRYLREHFKHWSMDMTLGYALNEAQELDLYLEIRDELDDIKLGVADQWFQDESLAGGYGQNIVAWRSKDENVTLFEDRAAMIRSIAESTAIRSNGHAWCTADDYSCVGNTLERTRCSGCSNAVIGRVHARLYRRLYDDLIDVLKCDDIGIGGQARVRRDMERCREVLVALGYDPKEATPA